VRNLSIESLLWSQPKNRDLALLLSVAQYIKEKMPAWDVTGRSKEIYNGLAKSRAILDNKLKDLARSQDSQKLEELLDLDPAHPFEVHSLRPMCRVGPDGELLNDLVIEITQRRPGSFDEAVQKQLDARWKETGEMPLADFVFRGGCTLLVDMNTSQVRYCIYKHLDSENRLRRQRAFQTSQAYTSLCAGSLGGRLKDEPFALKHRAAGVQEDM
jgi:hypothetical protein